MMKGKLFFSFLLGLLFTMNNNSNGQQVIQGTIRPGASANEMEIWLKPNFSSNTDYLFQVSLPVAYPAGASPLPTGVDVTLDAAFVSSFGNNYTVTVNPVATASGGTEQFFTIVLVRNGAGASAAQTWTAGTEFKVLNLSFAPSGAPASLVKLADYQSGGSDKQGNFYTQSGTDHYYVSTVSSDNFYASSGSSTVGGTATDGYVQTIATVPPPSCAVPSAPVASGITSSGAVINWGTVSGGIGYEYAVTTFSTPPASGTATTNTTYTASGLAVSTTYYVHVRTDCGGGSYSTWVSTPFTTDDVVSLIRGSLKTGVNPNEVDVWLRPNFNNSTKYLFQIGLPIAFSATAGVPPTGINVTLDAGFVSAFGNNYTVTVNPVATVVGGTEKYFTVLLVRDGAGASTAQTWAAGTEFKVLTVSFAPVDAPAAFVKLADYQDGGSDKLGNFYTQSSTDDYYVLPNSMANFYASAGESTVGGTATAGYAQTISTIPNGACVAPAVPTAGSVTGTGATISWNGVSGEADYEYVLTSSSTAPASAGTAITGTNYTATGLSAGTLYYFYLRTACNSGKFSTWVQSSFTTLCSTPPEITVSNIGATADVSWDAVAGVTGYEYVVTTSSTAPAFGTATTGTSFEATGLISSTQYYVHVRSQCGSNNFSAWNSKAFNVSCIAPMVVGVLNGDGADISWGKINGASRYEYAVTTYSTAPLSGVMTRDTSYRVENLAAGKGYYFHVRTHCAAGGVSGWVSFRLNTLGLDAYPNPVRNDLTVVLYGGASGDGVVSVYDAMGKVVRQVSMIGSSVTVDMRGLAEGVYLVRYVDGERKYTVRILKKLN